jgi:MoaD family protein
LKVRVLYFASARDIAAVSSEHVPLHEKASVGDLAGEMIRLHPSLKNLEGSVRYSVNYEVADRSTPLRDGDEVGVLPPVAGG